ncbi:MAG: Universal stress protein [Myxococcaceae bacterium]|nr:Universal stress protein [Myxococcaceae bacterium]
MTIVCAIHFSDSSLAAVKVAARLARTHREPLWLVEVVPFLPLGSSGPPSDLTLSPALVREAAALARDGIVVNTAVICGPLDRAVERFCSAKGPALLVVGDSQQTLAPLIVGPLDRFADRLSVPVLIIRDSKPFEAWASGTAPLRVMLAVDRTWKPEAACEWIAGLAAYGAIELVASYLWSPKDESERRAFVARSGRVGGHALSEQLWVEAQAVLGGLPPNVTRQVRLQASGAQVGSQLLRMATVEHADVFVLGTHPHSGPVGQQWSLSHELLALAPMSVACVPDPVMLPTRQHDDHRFRAAS